MPTVKHKNYITESELQKQCFKALRFTMPLIAGRTFAIPNGGHRHIKVAAKLKAEGVMAGVWDVFVAVPSAKYGGLFIELKNGRNKLTKKQQIFQQRLSGDYAFGVAYSVDEFIGIIRDYAKDANV